MDKWVTYFIIVAVLAVCALAAWGIPIQIKQSDACTNANGIMIKAQSGSTCISKSVVIDVSGK